MGHFKGEIGRKGPRSQAQARLVQSLVLTKFALCLGVPRDELVGDIHGGCVDGEPVDHPHDLIVWM